MLSVISIMQHQGTSWYEEQLSSPTLSQEGETTSGQLVVMTYGKCLYWINGEKTMAERGDFLFIPSQLPYYGKSIPTVFHEKIVIRFRMEQSGAIPLLNCPLHTMSKAGIYEMCVERLRAIQKEWIDESPYATVRAAALLLDMLALWSRELDRGQLSVQSGDHAARMKQYIADHYREKITKAELGDCIGRSPNHAAALFRQHTGQTISQYVHHVRMRTAQYLLRESLLNISEIAEYLGYSDVSYFQRLFKRAFGYPPSVALVERSSHSL
ncbi:AraC family transcriptional regulator [Paenibacillus sp. J5C_2022]|uniref:helix-turn-helix transcriptional regulator n=1 Tax=Paenibacillus sp. J5C2022 TaxID=2977129 RepID=UPI0021CE22AF|nr:AraC family transcriptional regulator [Paenibacillus sp. J5C2022]MCU6708146.1 AraC family transcriptional regulator [Paenibacillus sp. J5C2022]